MCQYKNGLSAVTRPFVLILFLRCTTSALLEYWPDGHLAKLLPFLSGACV